MENNRVSTNIIAEFRNKTLERKYIESSWPTNSRFIRSAILILGIGYMLIAVFDPLLKLTTAEFGRSLISRGSILLIAIVAFIILRKDHSYNTNVTVIGVFEVLAFLAYMAILIIQRHDGFIQQAFVVILYIWIVTALQTRWIVSMFIAIFYCVFFLAATPFYIEGLTFNMSAEIATYFICALALSGVGSYRLNIYQRTQFVRECQLKTLSQTDKLTDTFNRQKFDEVLKEWCSGAGKFGGVFSIIILDIDNFKRVNDTHGHLTGDEVLVELAGLIRQSKRADDVFARWGGEEFILLLPNTPLSSAVDMAERMRIMVAGHKFINSLHIACSFGVTAYSPQDTPVSVLNRVDSLLYRAKANGKNIVVS